ncbi:MAG: hypothetical protein SPLUMA2_SPLUMAMAG2_01490 [uncultured Sulfurimonas sp.]|nr:MAG: hypothetical protein SPLUMA2_SPLUMAMAG2_01490 [uncultured Sulfurimonas sp.]
MLRWQPLAKQGHANANAQYNLGLMYKYGDGVLKDMTKAKYWTKKAYENPDTFVRKQAKEHWEKHELWKY